MVSICVCENVQSRESRLAHWYGRNIKVVVTVFLGLPIAMHGKLSLNTLLWLEISGHQN